MTSLSFDLLLQPGDLATLFAADGVRVSSSSPLAGSPLVASALPSRSHAEIASGIDAEELHAALVTLAMPSLVFDGRRGARRMEPWPFVLYRGNDGAYVMLADDGGGQARLRSPYSVDALADWLAGPFRRFAAPEIACAEIPALAPSGLAVMLALTDVFRDRYPDLDPDWHAAAPITFTSAELQERLAQSRAGRAPSSIMQAVARLGGPGLESLSSETVDSLLYLFANEGYLEMDVTTSGARFTMSDAFLGTLMSLAWWDMSLALEPRAGGSLEPIRVVQGLALWRFITGTDGRTTMWAVSGQELEMEIRALLTAPVAARCTACGNALGLQAQFCGRCGQPVTAPGDPRAL